MNTLIFISGLIYSMTSLVHLIGGQIDPVRPFLNSDLADNPKAVLLVCFHVFSAILVASGILLSYVGWYNIASSYDVMLFLSALYVIFALIFLGIGFYYFRFEAITQLPHWILLLPIGVLGIMGAM